MTGDQPGTADGRIDRVALTFSEPVTHAAEAAGPFAIALRRRTRCPQCRAASGAARRRRDPADADPDGGAKPDVTVIDGADSARRRRQPGLRRRRSPARRTACARCSSPPSSASATPAAAAVEPAAERHRRLHERDLVRGRHPCGRPEPDGRRRVHGRARRSRRSAARPRTDVPLVEGGSPDRDRSGSVAYTAPAGVPVVDARRTRGARAPHPRCSPPRRAPTTSTSPTTAAIPGQPAGRRRRSAPALCAADEDWFRIPPDAIRASCT